MKYIHKELSRMISINECIRTTQYSRFRNIFKKYFLIPDRRTVNTKSNELVTDENLRAKY